MNAVMLALAGCGGGHVAEPQGPNRTEALVIEPPPDAAFAEPPPPVDAGAAAATDPRALCDAHAKTPVDRTKATPERVGHGVKEYAYLDPQSGLVHCSIVRERKQTTVKVMYTPHWCPQGGGKPPKPYLREVQGERVLVEQVSIRPDGTIAKSDLSQLRIGMLEDEPRHNCGRRFEGLELEGHGDAPGAQLAAMAELEAASVPAFERLARELAHWNAPTELVRRARRAMGDEVRHARVMSALAREYGYEPRAIDVPALPIRDLDAIARENVIEGCVHEAFGALVATYQAERARPALREVFRAIAVDEREHVALAEDVQAWIGVDTERARRTAEHELRTNLRASRECSELGLPDAAAAIALYDAYFTTSVVSTNVR
jgi:hypothetical protein